MHTLGKLAALFTKARKPPKVFHTPRLKIGYKKGKLEFHILQLKDRFGSEMRDALERHLIRQ